MVKNFSRRFMAYLLSMALVVTYAIPVSVYAGVEAAPKGTTEIESAGGTLYFDEGGSWVDKDGDWVVKTTAKAKAVAGAADTYDITLDVESKTAALPGGNAALVLALDMSKSVNQDIIKRDAQMFLESLMDGAGNASRKVAIVEFASNVKTITPFIEANDNGKLSQDVIDAIGEAEKNFSTEISYIETRINPQNGKAEWRCTHGKCNEGWHSNNNSGKGRNHTHTIKGGTSTNIDGAMMMARNLIANNSGLAGYQGSVVLITDGAPTVSSNIEAYKWDRPAYHTTETAYMMGTNYGGNATGGKCEREDYGYMATAAAQLKAVDANLYFVLTKPLEDGQFNDWDYVGGTYDRKFYTDGSYQKVGAGNARNAYANFLTNLLGGNLLISGPNQSLTGLLDSVRQNIERDLNNSGMALSNPMGDFIDFISCEDASVTCVADKMTWKPANGTEANGVKKYTVTYRVKADATSEAFAQEAAKARDGVVHFTAEKLSDRGWSMTTLTYGENEAIAYFDMPTFKGTVPEVNYSIEYYKQALTQGEDGNWVAGDFELQENDSTLDGVGKLHDFVQADQNYLNKYAADNYELAADKTVGMETVSNISGLKLKANTDNALKLYYTPKAANVTVNYTYRTLNTWEDGSKSTSTSAIFSDQKTGYVGKSFEVNVKDYETDKNGIKYNLVASESDNAKITVNADATKNVINLVFEGSVDHRAKATYAVKAIIAYGEWKLNEDGKYEVVYGSYDTDNPILLDQGTEAEDYRAGDVIKVNLKANAVKDCEYMGNPFGLFPTEEKPDELNMVLAAGDQTLNLLYHKAPADTRVKANVTVNHVYTCTKYVADENGKIVPTTPVDHATVQQTIDGVYVDETFTPEKVFVYDGKTYANTEDLEAKTLVAGENTFTIEYSLVEVPDSATVTVNHHFLNETTVFDEESGEATGLAWTENTGLAKSETVSQIAVPDGRDFITRDLYVGEFFKAMLLSVDEMLAGYDVREDKNGEYLDAEGNVVPHSMILTGSAEKNVIDIYYFKEAASNVSSIKVTHKYVTYKDVIDANGRLVKDQPQEAATGETVTVNGKLGGSYEFTTITEFDGVTYTLVDADNSKLSGTFKQAGSNGEVVLTYVRHIDDADLTPGFLKVAYKLIGKHGKVVDNTYTYEYYTGTKNADGSRHYQDEMVAAHVITQEGIKVFAPGETASSPIPEKVYAGQKFTLDLDDTYDYDGLTYTKTDGSAEVTVGGVPVIAVRAIAEDGVIASGDMPVAVEIPPTNVITYENVIDLAKNDINVVRVVTTLTSDDNGEQHETTTTSDAIKAGTVYDGQYLELGVAGNANETFTGLTVENATATDVADGKTNVTVTDISKAATVTLLYTVDLSKHARGTVTHNYIRHDKDGKVADQIVETKEDKISKFAGLEYTATDRRTGAFTDRVVVVGGSWTMTLHEGDDNNMTINYYDDYESLTGTQVLVNHVYFKTDASGLLTTRTAIEMQVPQVLTKADRAWIGNTEFSVEPKNKPVDDGYYYDLIDGEFEVEGADGELVMYSTDAYSNLTLEAPEAGESYSMVINMYYVRSTTAVQINHIYKALDTRTDKITEDTKVTVIDEKGEGKYGTWTKNEDGNFVSFTAKEMPKDGYTRTTADEDMITYDFGEGAILNVEYVREYRSRKPGGGGRSGGDSDIPDDGVPLSDIPEDEVPLTDLPGGTNEEEMIPDDEVPLAELPITGGMGVGLFILAGGAIAAAGFGLRRREEEN